MVIVFSAESDFPEETVLVRRLFEAGLERFHLRKPLATSEVLRSYLEQIPHEFHPRIVVHQHHALTNDFALGGIHFPEKDRENAYLTNGIRNPALIYSTGAHSIGVVKQLQADFDLLFLSPVFPSISKSGYAPAEMLSIAGNPEINPEKIVALGGIDLRRLESCRENGFQHIALLGAIWQNAAPIATFTEIQEKWLKSNPIA